MTKPIRPKDTRYRVYWSCSNCGKTGVRNVILQQSWESLKVQIEGTHFKTPVLDGCGPWAMNIQRIVRVFKKRER